MYIYFGETEHFLTSSNAITTVFEDEVWKFMGHVYHYCGKDCPAQLNTVLVSFDAEAVEYCEENLDRVLIAYDEPTENEFIAWEKYRDENGLPDYEIVAIVDQAKVDFDSLESELHVDLFERLESEFDDDTDS